MSPRPQTKSYEAPALRKGIQLLQLLCQAPEPLSVAQISQQLRINKHMVLRLLGTLCDEGWVVQEKGPVYYVSLTPLYHFSQPLKRMDVLTAAEKPIAEFWELTGETTYMSIRDGDWSMGVVIRQTRREVQISGRIGSRLMMHCCAPGKVLLAHAEPELLERLAKKGFARQTEMTICDSVKLRQHLQEVVRQGFATDNEEYLAGMICLAAPVFDYTGRAVSAVGMTTLRMFHTHQSMLDQYTKPLLATCREISRRLGYTGSPASTGTESAA